MEQDEPIEMRVARFQASQNELLESFKWTLESGRRATQSALILNGGAAVALMTFLGHAYQNGGIELEFAFYALMIFGIGTLSAGITFGFTYFSQAYYTQEIGLLNSGDKRHERARMFGFRWQIAAVVTGLISYVLFAGGIWCAGRALY